MNDSPLAGLVVGVTADRRREEQASLLIDAGARVLHAPTIESLPSSEDGRLKGAIDAVIERPPDIVVLSTGLGVRTLLEAAVELDRADRLKESIAGATVITRGPKAYAAATSVGWPVEWSTSGATTPQIVNQLASVGVAGKRVAVLLDGNEEPVLANEIDALGAEVVPLSPYTWRTTSDTVPVLRMIEQVAEERIDAVTFTSSPAVWGLAEIAEQAGTAAALRASLSGRVLAVCVGPVCAHAAEEAGFLNIVQPQHSRLGLMVKALSNCVEETEWVARLGASSLVLRASAVVVDGEVIDLAPRERDVLTRLARRPGAVVAKEVLLRHIWHDQAETHAVETVVNRLRRRLERTAVRIMTVHKRGYCLAPAG